jgi:hypothetical protein
VGSLLDEVPGIEPLEEFLETVEKTDGHTEILGARKHFRFVIDSLIASHPKRISTTCAKKSQAKISRLLFAKMTPLLLLCRDIQ